LIAPAAPVEIYVDEPAADRLVREFALRPSRDPNVVLRIVPDEVRSWIPGPDAPRIAIALDLAEDGDPRGQIVAREVLERR
jgi:hypothetical protein